MRTIDPENIDRLRKALTRKPQSVRTLAKKLKCSRGAVMRWVGRIYGVRSTVMPEAEGERGPKSVGYYL